MQLRFSVNIPDSVARLAGQAALGVNAGLGIVRAKAADVLDQAGETLAQAKDNAGEALNRLANDVTATYRGAPVIGESSLADIVGAGANAVTSAAQTVGAVRIQGRPLSKHLAAAGEDVKIAANNAILGKSEQIRAKQEASWRTEVERVLRDGIIKDNHKDQCIAYIVNNYLAPVSGSDRDEDKALLSLSILRDAYNDGSLAAADYKKILRDFGNAPRNDLSAAKALGRSNLNAAYRGKTYIG